MKVPECPEIGEFRPTNFTTVSGVGYFGLKNSAGVRLTLSQQGYENLREKPELTNSLTSIGELISENDGLPLRVAHDELLATILRVSDRQPDYHQVRHKSSVYKPSTMGGIVLKAYDLEPRLARTQFETGAWFHERSKKMDDTTQLTGPAHYGLFKARGGHQVSVMECVEGRSLQEARFSYSSDIGLEETQEAARIVFELVAANVGKLLGKKGAFLFNDLHARNIILNDPEPLTLCNVHSRKYSIIDQPYGSLKISAYRTLSKTLGLLQPMH